MESKEIIFLSHESYGGGTNNLYVASTVNGGFATSFKSHKQAIINLKREVLKNAKTYALSKE